MGCAASETPLRATQTQSRFPYCNTLDEVQVVLRALESRELPVHRTEGVESGYFLSGNGFKGEGETFGPNTPRDISQSAGQSGLRA